MRTVLFSILVLYFFFFGTLLKAGKLRNDSLLSSKDLRMYLFLCVASTTTCIWKLHCECSVGVFSPHSFSVPHNVTIFINSCFPNTYCTAAKLLTNLFYNSEWKGKDPSKQTNRNKASGASCTSSHTSRLRCPPLGHSSCWHIWYGDGIWIFKIL